MSTSHLLSSEDCTSPVSCVQTIILTLGNPLRGDDGAGQEVYALLQKHTHLPPEVKLVDGGTAGLETVLLLQGYQRAIIVDAAEMGSAPGSWQRFTRGDAQLTGGDLGDRGTLHYAGLAEALELAEALGLLPNEVIFYGIEPQQIAWTPGLSQSVLAAVPEVCAAIIKEIRNTRIQN